MLETLRSWGATRMLTTKRPELSHRPAAFPRVGPGLRSHCRPQAGHLRLAESSNRRPGRKATSHSCHRLLRLSNKCSSQQAGQRLLTTGCCLETACSSRCLITGAGISLRAVSNTFHSSPSLKSRTSSAPGVQRSTGMSIRAPRASKPCRPLGEACAVAQDPALVTSWPAMREGTSQEQTTPDTCNRQILKLQALLKYCFLICRAADGLHVFPHLGLYPGTELRNYDRVQEGPESGLQIPDQRPAKRLLLSGAVRIGPEGTIDIALAFHPHLRDAISRSVQPWHVAISFKPWLLERHVSAVPGCCAEFLMRLLIGPST